MSLEQATLTSDNTVYMQLALDLGPPEVKQTAYDMGIKTQLDGYPAESLGGLTHRRLAAGDGERVRDDRLRRLPQPPDRDHEDHVPRRQVRAAAALQGQAHEGVRGRRHRRGDADPRQEHPGRHRHEGQHRLPGGRQDRHDRRVQRRVVRRLHPAPGDRDVGRLPRRPDRDDDRVPRRLGGRRHVPGRDLGRLHEGGQGQVLRRLQAAQDAVPVLARSSASTRAAAAAAPASSTTRRSSTSPPAPDRARPARRRREARRAAAATATATTGTATATAATATAAATATSTPTSTSRRRRATPPGGTDPGGGAEAPTG